VLAVQQRQEVIQSPRVAVHQLESVQEEVQTNLRSINRQEAEIYQKCISDEGVK
jgi:hypothetical protein